MEGGVEKAARTTRVAAEGVKASALRRLFRAAIVAGAGMLAVMLVGSVLALLTDTVTLAGGYAESNNWVASTLNPTPTPEPNDALDLRVKSGVCDPMDDLSTYSDDPTISLGGGFVDLATAADIGASRPDPVEIGTYCLYNASAFDGDLAFSMLSASSTEIGSCDVTEAAQDMTCLPGEAGELAMILDVWVAPCGTQVFDPAGPSVGSLEFDLSHVFGVPQTHSALLAGATCQVALGVWTNDLTPISAGMPDPGLVMALTDHVEFNLSVDLEGT